MGLPAAITLSLIVPLVAILAYLVVQAWPALSLSFLWKIRRIT